MYAQLIACPEGHFKKTPVEVEAGCRESGKTCGNGFKCICRPCVKAEKVEIISMRCVYMFI
jgi:hypothetical protein